ASLPVTPSPRLWRWPWQSTNGNDDRTSATISREDLRGDLASWHGPPPGSVSALLCALSGLGKRRGDGAPLCTPRRGHPHLSGRRLCAWGVNDCAADGAVCAAAA